MFNRTKRKLQRIIRRHFVEQCLVTSLLFIKKEYRQKGITEELIKQAILYAKDNGAKYVEAYPVDPESPSYRFMGFKPIFDKLGFDLKHKVGQRRYVMTVKI